MKSIKLGIVKIKDKSSVMPAIKSTMLDKSPEKINSPLTNKSKPENINNAVNILALKESMSNINAEKISSAPNNFNIMKLVKF